jgi:CheY-like chemotaxis protein/ligand-binding sensor protein
MSRTHDPPTTEGGVPMSEPSADQERGSPPPSPELELTPALRQQLLDLAVWQEGLETYARATQLAVALVDTDGRLLGPCINPRPTWRLLRAQRPTDDAAGCPFCLMPSQPRHCIADTLTTGRVSITRDRTGLVHVIVPLVLGEHALGALVAGQVFDQYPEQLVLEHGAVTFGLSPHQVWPLARLDSPVKRIVELHGGTVTAHSDGPGQGSTFIIRLPVVREPSPARPRASRESARTAPAAARRILVVDDERLSATSWSKLLQRAGHAIRTAHDGLEAVSVADEFRPDVVLLDIGLPQLDGYEVADRIRHQPWGQGMVPIAVTGWGQEADRRRSTEAGFNHHLLKPVGPTELLRLLASLPSPR